MNTKAQANFVSFSNPIFLAIMVVLVTILLYVISTILGQVGNLLKVYLSNFYILTAVFVLAVGGLILGVIFFKDKISAKIALIGTFGLFGFFLLILFLPSIAVATDGVLVTVTANINMPGVVLGIQTGSISIQSASVTNEQANSPVVPTPQSFSLAPLMSVLGGPSCNSAGQCYTFPPPAGFIGLGASVAVQVTAVCNGQSFFNQANVPENTILSFSSGGNQPVNVVLNNLPDHSTCTFTATLICNNGPTCSSTPYTFTSGISSVNTGGG